MYLSKFQIGLAKWKETDWCMERKTKDKGMHMRMDYPTRMEVTMYLSSDQEDMRKCLVCELFYTQETILFFN